LKAIENSIANIYKKGIHVQSKKGFWLPYVWRPKMGVSHHLKNVDHWMAIENGFHSPSKFIYFWMVIEIFWLLAIEFGKGACYMFLENSFQILCVTIKGDQKFSH
jgi:hypothetical protein